MRFYRTNDEIYLFGFSRGAYVARFLAEMLDYIGLLSHGNEEMVRFAWKAFSQWQARRSDDSPEGIQKKKKMYEFLKGFRETFSRPVRRIRFLGLFDTVNSVPQFESAWMGRSKFPYTARTSAKVVRHAVSIDERRAKFRQDLIYQSAAHRKCKDRHTAREKLHELQEMYRGRSHAHASAGEGAGKQNGRGRRPTLAVPEQEPAPYRTRSHSVRSRRTNRSGVSGHDGHSEASVGPHPETDDDGEDFEESEDEHEQDIDEVWFAGGHADVGGGWSVEEGQKPASHIPLCWMVREAMHAGLHFDSDKIQAMGCVDLMDQMGIEHGPDTNGTQGLGGPAASNANGVAKQPGAVCTCSNGKGNGNGNVNGNPHVGSDAIPNITVRSPSTPKIFQQSSWKLNSFSSKNKDKSGKTSSPKDNDKETAPDDSNSPSSGPVNSTTTTTTTCTSSSSSPKCPLHPPSPFPTPLHHPHTSPLHDSLSFSCSSLPFTTVLAWKLMEYLPFRRLDLDSSNGSWKPIRWPLPCGEVRDIPENARVHGSVIRRMQLDENYRPGNLIVGGGGRGVKRAGKKHGMGEWVCVKERGDVGEVWVRRGVLEGKEGGKGDGDGEKKEEGKREEEENKGRK